MNTEEIISTEILEESSTETETVVEVDAAALVPYLEQIAFDVRVIMALAILTFCQACLRAWRNNTLKMGR